MTAENGCLLLLRLLLYAAQRTVHHTTPRAWALLLLLLLVTLCPDSWLCQLPTPELLFIKTCTAVLLNLS